MDSAQMPVDLLEQDQDLLRVEVHRHAGDDVLVAVMGELDRVTAPGLDKILDGVLVESPPRPC